MTNIPSVQFANADWPELMKFTGSIAVFATSNGIANGLAKEFDGRCGGQISRFRDSRAFKGVKEPGTGVLACPHEFAAEAVIVAKLPDKATPAQMKKLGAEIGSRAGKLGLTVLAGDVDHIDELSLGISLGLYSFDAHRTKNDSQGRIEAGATVIVDDREAASACHQQVSARAQGVYLTRDLVNEPSNVLTTIEFATRLEELRSLGLVVTVLEEDELRRIGMQTLLAVGEGSASPSKVVLMEWRGSSEPPLAVVGKGVVFDTGGISLKPSARMEEMTMDMAGAGVVAGVMKTLALRKAPAHVVGAVGLVENMPGGRAQRPGDVVVSLKGDTVEVTNTDAEGRLVLADVLWYVQEEYQPSAMIDLATLTGAIIVSLGSDLAGIFSNDDDFVGAFLDAAKQEGEGAWRMPLHDPYDRMLKSRIADTNNVGGREAGAVTAAQFLKRFVKPECPWIHMDIAGVAYSGKQTGADAKGATGWGVQSIDRLVRERFESR